MLCWAEPSDLVRRTLVQCTNVQYMHAEHRQIGCGPPHVHGPRGLALPRLHTRIDGASWMRIATADGSGVDGVSVTRW